MLAVLKAAQHAHAVALADRVRSRQLAQDDHLRLPGLVHDIVGADHLCMRIYIAETHFKNSGSYDLQWQLSLGCKWSSVPASATPSTSKGMLDFQATLYAPSSSAFEATNVIAGLAPVQGVGMHIII